MRTVNITFQPQGKTFSIKAGETVQAAAIRHGVGLNASCGGAGTCGKCIVEVVSGKAEATAHDIKVLGKARVSKGFRLACKTLISSDMEVRIPAESFHSGPHSIITHDADTSRHVSPLITKKYESAVGGSGVRSAASGDKYVTVVRFGEKTLAVEAGNTVDRCYGTAFDIGTTTLVGTLIDLHSGNDLAVASMVNPQTVFGDDVISRIKQCREAEDGLSKLHDAIIGAINRLLAELYAKSGVRPECVYHAVFAGNTAMQEILCNINPKALGEIPFRPEYLDMQLLTAASLKIDMHPAGMVNVCPNIGGFVGGDTVSGVLASKLDKEKKPALLIDIGTNGEIVLSGKDGMIAASMAAGPAFEGARIVNGMRAAEGALSAFAVVKDSMTFKTIGDRKARGICGSGLIDIAAAFLDAGLIDECGRILDVDELPVTIPEFIRKRLGNDKDQSAILIADADETETGVPIFLYQKDIRELQLASAAICAGIKILLSVQGYTADDLSAVFVAGAFGNFIDVANAKRIGLLPQVPLKKMKFIGNSSSLGAKKILLSGKESAHAQHLASVIKHYDLSQSPAFQDEFAEAMLFPG